MDIEFSLLHPTFGVHASPSKYLLAKKSSKLMGDDSSSLSRSTEEFCYHPHSTCFKMESLPSPSPSTHFALHRPPPFSQLNSPSIRGLKHITTHKLNPPLMNLYTDNHCLALLLTSHSLNI